VCRRALVQGRRECVQIFKHERTPITRPSSRHSFPLTLHAPTVQRCPRQRRARSLKAIVPEAAPLRTSQISLWFGRSCSNT
jgi:hypothetical protein